MNKLPRSLRAALLAAVTLTTGLSAAQPKVGDPFPPLADAKLEGTLPATAGKIVLVDFWASWCGPCRAAFPGLKEIADKFKEQGVVVVGVSVDEDKADMDAFVRKLAPNFSIVRDTDSKYVEKLDVLVMPTTFIVDRQGNVAMVHSGYEGDRTKAEYIEQIERLLARKETNHPQPVRHPRLHRLLLLPALILLIEAGTGCTTVKPWERGTLADITMRPDSDPMGLAMEEHIFFSREATNGGRGVGGGGCGCS